MLHLGFSYACPVIVSKRPCILHNVSRLCGVFAVGSESPCDGILLICELNLPNQWIKLDKLVSFFLHGNYVQSRHPFSCSGRMPR
jgi:hypothetical protein